MIYLKKGQSLFNNEGMVVLDATGYYEDGANVICAMFHSPDEPICSYEAKFIAYGDQVYNITDEDKLMEEITKIDPSTLMGKTKEDINIDKMIEEIKTVENPTPETIPEENIEPEEEVTPISETVETMTEIDENGDEVTTTTTTTITEEIIPEEVVEPVIEPVVDIPEVPVIDVTPEVPVIDITPEVPVIDIETPIITPEIPVDPEEVIPSVLDQAVSKLKSKRKIV
jgi:hypothetical protein